MSHTGQREILVCIGGPLNARRLSIPMGIEWFTLSTRNIEIENAPVSDDGVILFETLNEVSNFSTSNAKTSSNPLPKTNIYVRKQLITGEKGSRHIFSFQQQ